MRFFVLVFLFLASLQLKAQPKEDIINYINTYKLLAMAEMQRTGIPAAIKLAQGIHETFAGKSELVLKSNNHFGIKCKSYWTGRKVSHDDDARGECFRAYDSASMSYRDHSDFLKGSGRYASLFLLDPTDYKGWAYGLRKAGYATNPKYAPIIIRLIEEYNLAQYSLIALGRMPASEEIIASATETPQALSLPRLDTASTPAPPEVVISEPVATPAEPVMAAAPAVTYPSGTFSINNTRVIFAKQGTPLLTIAQEHDISLKKLLTFNDMPEQEVLSKDQLVYLQKKRKTGNNVVHVVASGETLHDICQVEAIRLDNLLRFNHLQNYMQPAVGEKLYLHGTSPTRPKL